MSERTSGLGDPREACSDAERLAHHEEILRDSVRFAWEGVPFYRERLEAAGIGPQGITGIGDLPRIPITSKKEAQAGGLGTGTIPLHEAKRIFVSPGPHFYASQRRSDPPPQRGRTPLALAFHAMGFRSNDIILNTFSYHLTPGGFGLEEQLTTFGCAVIPAGPQNTAVQAQILASLPVAGFVGTPTFLQRLCEEAESSGLKPREAWKLEVAFVTAEKLTEDMRADLEERTGARVRQIYGSADGLLPAYECWSASGMHLHPDQITEVLDPLTWEPVPAGTPGAVVATAANPNRPLLRFMNLDLVALREDPCPCGRAGPRIERFVGRLDESTKVRGMFVYPEQIGEAVARVADGARWQAIVERGPSGDDFRVLVEAKEPAPDLAERIGAAIKSLVRVRAGVEIVAPGSIPADAKRLEDRRG